MESAACSFLQFPEIPPLRSGSRRVTAMLRNSPLNACDAFGGSWSGAESAMKTTAPILHRRAPAGCFAPCLRSTFRDRREIAGRVSVSQPSASPFMGSLFVFHDYPPPQDEFPRPGSLLLSAGCNLSCPSVCVHSLPELSHSPQYSRL